MEANVTPQKPKIKMAIYWAAACGGCCVSVLDVHESLFAVTERADIVFWPIALDTKYADIKALPNGYIDITLFSGAIRNSENEYMAMLLREKSKLLVAYGSCAHMGGIPGLANLYNKKEIFERVYQSSESTVNQNNTVPQFNSPVLEGILNLPIFFDDVVSLDKVVCVDFYLPGCPPQTERLIEVFMAVTNGSDLPFKKSVVGAREKSQCDECERKKSENKRIKKFYRPFEIDDDGQSCFLEQGVICMGPATRAGCGHRCIIGNAPCRGCYGPPPGAIDPGAKMMSAIGTMIDSNDPDEIQQIVDQIVDVTGTFYRFSLPNAILRKRLS